MVKRRWWVVRFATLNTWNYYIHNTKRKLLREALYLADSYLSTNKIVINTNIIIKQCTVI